MKILAVSGSLRADSYNTSLLRAASEAAPEGVDVELFEPSGIADLPLYDQDLDTGDVPEPAAHLREAWGSADAILFATPEYNGSVPGGLKNAVDCDSRPKGEAAILNATVGVIGASQGEFGGLWAQQELRRILGIAGARVVGEPVPVSRVHEGLDEAAYEGLRTALETLVQAADPVATAA